MSIKIDVLEPCGKNIAKLLHAVADYIDVNQKLNIDLKLDFKKEEPK